VLWLASFGGGRDRIDRTVGRIRRALWAALAAGIVAVTIETLLLD
jgi:hypothetical protein